MPDAPPVVVDTNVLFSALLGGSGRFAELLLGSEHRFCAGETLLVELFRHKEKIVSLSRLPEDDVVRLYSILMRRLELYREELIPPEHRAAAYELCREVDEADTPHVALALALNAVLWTGDRRLKEGLKQRGWDHFLEPVGG